MFHVTQDGTIRLTRGDTARLIVTIANDFDGREYTLADDDKLTLSVKRTAHDRVPCFQKEVIGGTQIHIAPADTADLSFGKYIYDVQLDTASGDVYTVIGPCDFEILREVTV